MYSEFREVLTILFREWSWNDLARRKYVANLIWTTYGAERKDNRVVQNVGRPIVKFKFHVGSYIGGSPTKTPQHFSISTTGKVDRIAWMAMPNGDLFVKKRRSKVWDEPFKVTGFFGDPTGVTDQEIEFLEFLYPGVVEQLPELIPGLMGVDKALEDRFLWRK